MEPRFTRRFEQTTASNMVEGHVFSFIFLLFCFKFLYLFFSFSFFSFPRIFFPFCFSFVRIASRPFCGNCFVVTVAKYHETLCYENRNHLVQFFSFMFFLFFFVCLFSYVKDLMLWRVLHYFLPLHHHHHHHLWLPFFTTPLHFH